MLGCRMDALVKLLQLLRSACSDGLHPIRLLLMLRFRGRLVLLCRRDKEPGMTKGSFHWPTGLPSRRVVCSLYLHGAAVDLERGLFCFQRDFPFTHYSPFYPSLGSLLCISSGTQVQGLSCPPCLARDTTIALSVLLSP